MNRIEQQLHLAIVAHLRLRGRRSLLWWHTPQGAHYSSPVQGRIMKGLGTLKGVSDLLLLHQGKFHAIELKACGAKPSKEQEAFLLAIEKAGGYAAVADNADLALEVLEGWGLLRGTAS